MFQTQFCNLEDISMSLLFSPSVCSSLLLSFPIFLFTLYFLASVFVLFCIHILFVFTHWILFIYFSIPSNFLYHFLLNFHMFFSSKSVKEQWLYLTKARKENNSVYQPNLVFYSAPYILLIRYPLHIHLLAHFLKWMQYKCLLRENLWTSAR